MVMELPFQVMTEVGKINVKLFALGSLQACRQSHFQNESSDFGGKYLIKHTMLPGKNVKVVLFS